MLSAEELRKLIRRCHDVPPTTNSYIATDYVSAVVVTVLDYQNRTTTVKRAMSHFNSNRWGDIRTLADLKGCLAGFPDDDEGNARLAKHLWGYSFSRRARQLRALVAYFDERGLSTLDQLRRWARARDFDGFRGKVPGIGYVLFQWLIMRLGVETVKPDSRLLRFVESAIGRLVSERETVDALEEVARTLGVKANELDWSIWEFEGA